MSINDQYQLSYFIIVKTSNSSSNICYIDLLNLFYISCEIMISGMICIVICII